MSALRHLEFPSYWRLVLPPSLPPSFSPSLLHLTSLPPFLTNLTSVPCSLSSLSPHWCLGLSSLPFALPDCLTSFPSPLTSRPFLLLPQLPSLYHAPPCFPSSSDPPSSVTAAGTGSSTSSNQVAWPKRGRNLCRTLSTTSDALVRIT